MRALFNNFRLRFGWSFQNMLQLGARQVFVKCGLAIAIMATSAPAQDLQTRPPNAQEGHGVTQTAYAESASALAPQKPTPRPSPPTSFRAEQETPNPPRISYNGGQLTIIAENSELADVLSLLSRRTGARIDFPPSATHERIWVEVGPGPARTVVATLLRQIDLDYAIQGSETDPQGIRSVSVSIRTTADMGEDPRQEDQASEKSEASTKAASEDLQPAPAERPLSQDIPESSANEPATFTELSPADWQHTPDALYNIVAECYPFDIVIAAHSNKGIAEDPRLTVYIGKPSDVDGKVKELPVNDSEGLLIRIRISAEEKPPCLSPAIFAGDPFRMRHNLEVSSRK
jgi:hypothetical protein